MVRRRVRCGTDRTRERTVLDRRSCSLAGRLGRADFGHGVGTRAVDRSTELAGLPVVGRCRHRRRSRPARRSERSPVGPPPDRGGQAGGVRPLGVVVRGRRRTGAGVRGSARSPARPDRSERGLVARSTGCGRRHDLHVHDRPQSDGCLAHPVERCRLRCPHHGARGGGVPPQPWVGLLPRRGPPGRTGARTSTAEHPRSGPGHQQRPSTAIGARHDGRRRPTAGRVADARSHAAGRPGSRHESQLASVHPDGAGRHRVRHLVEPERTDRRHRGGKRLGRRTRGPRAPGRRTGLRPRHVRPRPRHRGGRQR